MAQATRKTELTEACEGLWYAIISSVISDPYLFDTLHILNLSRAGGAFKGGMTVYREFLDQSGQTL